MSIFKNPVTKASKPVNELTMLDDLTPQICATIMSSTRTRDGIGKNYGHRAIIGAFLFKNPLVLFTDFELALQQYCGFEFNEAQRKHIETCVLSVYDETTPEKYHDDNMQFSFSINSFLMSNLNGHKTLAWMDEEDDREMWMMIYARMNRKRV